jgi:hypothetical protein
VAADDTDGAEPGSSTGPSVDRTGTPVIDPSKNVDALVDAAIRRQDDLRIGESRHIRELLQIRNDNYQALREADRHEAEMRAAYEDQLRTKETQRLDAIRAVDVANVESARQVAEARATTLQTQQQASADALRAQVEQARITTAESLEARVVPLLTAIEDLRRTQYQQQGEKSSKVETSSSDRDTLLLEQTRIAASQARMQMIALVIAALVVAVSLYAALHK